MFLRARFVVVVDKNPIWNCESAAITCPRAAVPTVFPPAVMLSLFPPASVSVRPSFPEDPPVKRTVCPPMVMVAVAFEPTTEAAALVPEEITPAESTKLIERLAPVCV